MRLIARLLGLLAGTFVIATVAGAIWVLVGRGRSARIDPPDADEIHLAATLSPLSYRSRAAAFRGGSIDTLYGGGIVDLREATIDPAGAHLDVRAIFGGGQLVVPESWNVTTSVRGIGGIGDGRRPITHPADGPTLTIDGMVLFGGFGISSDLSAEGEQAFDEAAEEMEKWTTSDESVPAEKAADDLHGVIA